MRDEHQANFNAWFGDSKVRDASGKPLVVYHGTTKDFQAFDIERSGENHRDAEGGIFLSSNPALASAYAGESGGSVIAAYVSLQHPDVIEYADSDADPQTYWDEGGFRNDGNGAVVRNLRSGEVMVVASGPAQIKSATGNSGLYDRTNPDITDRIAAADAALQYLTRIAPKKAIPHA